MAPDKVLEWLCEPEQPSVQYRALTQLEGRSETDPAVRAVRARIPKEGWAAEILSRQRSNGRWEDGEQLYQPKYLSTNWMLLVLSDLGITREDPRVAKACERWIRGMAAADGGFGVAGQKTAHLCTDGNTARGLIRLGYVDHPKVRSALEWLVTNQSHLGGWSCWGSGRNLDGWEGLSAFAAYPRSKWNAGMQRAVERAAEFFLQRELMHQGDHYEPWFRFHYPIYYYYDLLVGLDVLTALGYADDPRLRPALQVMEGRKRKDGRWNLDAVHPDVEGGMLAWYEKHPKKRPTPFALETVGRHSKMITLTARHVAARCDGTA